MKILKLLNRKYLTILSIIFLLSFNVIADDEPIDIWNIEKEETNGISKTQSLDEENNQIKSTSEIDIYKMQTQKKNDSKKRVGAHHAALFVSCIFRGALRAPQKMIFKRLWAVGEIDFADHYR